MLSLSKDLVRYLLIPLKPRELSSLITSCRYIYRSTKDDRFYRDYWRFHLNSIKYLIDTPLIYLYSYESWRSLVVSQLRRIQPFLNLLQLLDLTSAEIIISSFNHDDKSFITLTSVGSKVIFNRSLPNNRLIDRSISEMLIEIILRDRFQRTLKFENILVSCLSDDKQIDDREEGISCYLICKFNQMGSYLDCDNSCHRCRKLLDKN